MSPLLFLVLSDCLMPTKGFADNGVITINCMIVTSSKTLTPIQLNLQTLNLAQVDLTSDKVKLIEVCITTAVDNANGW